MSEEDRKQRELVAQLAAALAATQQQMGQLTLSLGQQAQLLAQVATAVPVTAQATISVTTIFERFKRAYQDKPCWKHAKNRLTPFVAEFGTEPADKVTPPRWAAFRDMRKQQNVRRGRKDQKVSALTVNFELDWVKRMFNWAMEPEQGLIAANPLELAHREKTRSKRETWIDESDLQALLAAPVPALARPRAVMRAFVLTKMDAGLRFNELRKLRTDRCRQRGDGFVVADVGRTKNGKTHLVGITARAWVLLREILPVPGAPFFFANPKTRKPYNQRTMGRWFREMCEAIGLDARVADGDVRMRAHDLRHSSATAADRRGASLSAIQQMLNHSSPSITMRYIHRSEESAVALARLMQDGAAEELRRGSDDRRPPQRATSGDPGSWTAENKKTE